MIIETSSYSFPSPPVCCWLLLLWHCSRYWTLVSSIETSVVGTLMAIRSLGLAVNYFRVIAGGILTSLASYVETLGLNATVDCFVFDKSQVPIRCNTRCKLVENHGGCRRFWITRVL